MTVSQLFDLSNDVAVVTGAGRGIGEGIARTLASAGAAVVCAARRTEEIERVCSSIKVDASAAARPPQPVRDPRVVAQQLARHARPLILQPQHRV